MSADDKETPPKLPRAVETALAKARDAARADRARKGGKILALVPVGVAVLVLLLTMPRATEPEAIPLPRVDTRVTNAIARDEDARARAAEASRLPTDVLAVGTMLRGLKRAEAQGADDVQTTDARRRLDAAINDLQTRDHLEEDMLSLRALQVRRFVDALSTWESTGEKTADLTELGGNFLERAEEAGWVKDRHVLMDETARRIAFKAVWNSLLSVEGRPAFAMTVDEQRALYAFYIEHPHVPDTRRAELASQRAAATSAELCVKANTEEHRQVELWRAEKLKRLGTIDPTYPTAYALGVAYYRAGRFDLSVDAFTAHIALHPDGPYGLRAKNHLKAALVAHGAL